MNALGSLAMRASGLILRILGTLLLTAAALKAWGLGVDPVARTGVFSSAGFQLLVMGFEISLGLWLVSGKSPAGAWMVAVLTFTLFAGVTFYQGWIGLASCGCAGRIITINPWLAFAVDMAALPALMLGRPDLQPLWVERKAIALYAGCGLAGYLALAGALVALGYYEFGSIETALASLRSERLSVDPRLVDMGEGVAGEARTASITLTNRTEAPIRVIGGTADCSCTVLGDLPVTIAAGESRSISVQLRLPNSKGVFSRGAKLTIDDEGFKTVGFRLTGRIRKASE
jgi:Protein of unknown function (DUF1573)